MTKDQIIAEIQRTAEENGGQPLGRLGFLSETGIRESDWRGRYWARWNDALKEAGFGPNQLQPSYDDSLVLDKLAQLTRELGRAPVMSEYSLKAREDKSFPSSKVLRRFGTKQQLLAKLLQHVQGHEAFIDVAPLLSVPDTASSSRGMTRKRKLITGFVYLIKSGRRYKIGRTNSVGRREWELGIKIPLPPRVIHSIETDDPIGIEAYWHKRFADKRGEGEWFDLSPDDVQAFKRWKRIT